MSVAAMQETKWFGASVWEAQGYTLLHSGCPLPHGEEPAVKKEGVGIALDERATSAWREAGEKWKAVSSRTCLSGKLLVLAMPDLSSRVLTRGECVDLGRPGACNLQSSLPMPLQQGHPLQLPRNS